MIHAPHNRPRPNWRRARLSEQRGVVWVTAEAEDGRTVDWTLRHTPGDVLALLRADLPAAITSSVSVAGMCRDPRGETAGPGAVGEVVLTATAVVTVAVMAADWLGVDLEQLVRDGADEVLSWFGIGTCSEGNKEKYRTMVDGASVQQLYDWLSRKPPRVGGATEACNEYAVARAARRLKMLADDLPDEAAPPANTPGIDAEARFAEVRRIMAGRRFSDQVACTEFLRGLRRQDEARGLLWPVPFRQEMARTCTRLPLRSSCPPTPSEATVAAMGTDGWCNLDADEQQALVRAVRSLTDAEVAQLMRLPWAERRAAFVALTESRQSAYSADSTDGSSTTWGILAAVLALVGLGIVAKRGAS